MCASVVSHPKRSVPAAIKKSLRRLRDRRAHASPMKFLFNRLPHRMHCLAIRVVIQSAVPPSLAIIANLEVIGTPRAAKSASTPSALPPRSVAIANLEVIGGPRAAKSASTPSALPPRSVDIANLEVIGGMRKSTRSRISDGARTPPITTQKVLSGNLCGNPDVFDAVTRLRWRSHSADYHTEGSVRQSVW